MKNLSAALAVLVVLLASVLACKLPASLSSNSSSTTNGSTANGSTSASKGDGFTPTGDGMADLKTVSKRFTEADAFQATMDSTGDKPLKMEVEYVRPDRYHVKNESMESIIIGRDTYMKLNGAWRKFPTPLDQTISSLRDMFTEEGLKTLADVKQESDDTVDGEDAIVYSYTGKVPQTSNTYNSKLFIGKDDGLPLKIEVEYSGGPLKKMTTVYRYSPDVKIEAPIAQTK